MRQALALAARGLGQVWPNPAVGCVIVANGRVVGRGHTRAGGRPHAETEALRAAGAAARGATAYVSLEPCNHHGATPPCAQALIEAGVARAVVSLRDPDPRVDGGGIARLRAAGVAVLEDLLAEPARRLNAGFLSRIQRGRPLVTLKLAGTLDGRIATASGESRWITGEVARARAHRLRATHDAVLVGAQTARLDDPELTCRLPGWSGRQPVRIVLDSRLRLSPDSRLARGADRQPTWCLCAPEAIERGANLRAKGVELLAVPRGADGRLDLAAALRLLGGRGLTRLLVEGGAELAASLLRARLVDRVAWFRAPLLLGQEGRPAVAELQVARLAEAIALAPREWQPLGPDLLETFDVTA
ncbi:MAG: bifunctional diaminohydroxyphosphoribosylaminopyrimidine deaminase/5-amino-6-(5-phosphoribosylamino)uracil reductase RibD [Alphaproteobacteria bacterium]|nr:bifunctional diaminohydroxyphosphoribosylaminopyrimidine deaminase/5-amino-6-(5-phosphoribosylamino)uracil reductase RibD [Alphaproteobacteria bacterium]